MRASRFAMLTLLVAGCSSTSGPSGGGADLATGTGGGGATGDMAKQAIADLSVAAVPDLSASGTSDMAVALDMTTPVPPPDLAVSHDLAIGNDMTVLHDMTVVHDLTAPPPDLTTPPPDMTIVHDMTTTPPPDMTAPPACGGGCSGGQICCNNSCVDPTSDAANCGACGNVCATGLCGSGITAPMTTAPANWSFNGSATYDATNKSAVLTQATNGQTGTVIYKNPIATDSFDVAFDFRVSPHGADGLGFMIEKEGSTAIGNGGGGFGMAGLTGYGVELDAYDNGVCGDVDGNHTGVDSLTTCTDSQDCPTSLTSSPNLSTLYGYDIGDNTWRTVSVHVVKGVVTVTINQGTSVNTAAVSNISLPGFVAGDKYYFGFGGATGGINEKSEIRNVSVTFPTARCL